MPLKRPPPAFHAFMEEFRKEYKKKHPENRSVATVSKQGVVKWKAMSDSEKAPYVAKAAAKRAGKNAEYGVNRNNAEYGVNRNNAEESCKDKSPEKNPISMWKAMFDASHNSGNGELSKRVAELERMLEDAKADILAEREKALKEAQKANEENAELRYRISYLLRALEKADSVLASK